METSISCRFTYKNAINEWFPRATILGEESFARAPAQMRQSREEERKVPANNDKSQKLIDGKLFLWLPTEDPVECKCDIIVELTLVSTSFVIIMVLRID